MPESKTFEKPVSPEGCWIKYRLALRGIKLDDVAKKAHRTVATVSRVICGTRKSAKVEAVLAEMLDYPSWESLWAAAFVNAERKAV